MDLFKSDQKIGTLVIEIVEAKDLAPMDSNGTSDPYVVCYVGKKKKRTKIIFNTLNPVWSMGEQEIFTFPITKKTKTITLECYDYDKYTADDREGLVKVNLDDISDGNEHDKWYFLEAIKQGDTVSGSLHVKMKFTKRTKNESSDSSAKKNPLFEAVRDGDMEGLSNILKVHKVDINARDEDACTALHIAVVDNQNPKIVLALLHDPDIKVDIKDNQGNTAFHRFAGKFNSVVDYQEIMDIFIQKLQNIDMPNLNGDTVLHKSCFNPSTLFAEHLMSKGADPLKANKNGETPLHYAVRLGRVDVCEVLLAGAPPLADYSTAIKLAEDLKFTNIAKLISAAKELIIWLHKHGLQSLALTFLKNEIFLEIVPDVDEANLVRMGVSNANLRNKMLSIAKALKTGEEPHHVQNLSPRKKEDKKMEKTQSKPNLEVKLRQLPHVKVSHRVGGTPNWLIAEEELQLEQKLGSGASGTVYKGRYLDGQVAIKVLPTVDEATMREFEREFQVISALDSPHAVKFYGISIKNQLCLVMEYCERGSIFNILEDLAFNFTWPTFFDFAVGTLAGINALHSSDPPIMHRDLKSLNLLVDADGNVKVCDFGLSRFDTSSNLKTLSVLRGTYAYVAPEVYFGKKFTPKSDIYSIGILLWEMVYRLINKTYVQPFGEYPAYTQAFQILIASAKKDVRPTIPASCPAELKTVITRSWDKDPEKRPTTQELLRALELLRNQFHENKDAWNAAIAK